MSRYDELKIEYLVAVVADFAKATGQSQIEAFKRLYACGGIKALDEEYDIEHTLPIDATIDALKALCSRAEAARA